VLPAAARMRRRAEYTAAIRRGRRAFGTGAIVIHLLTPAAEGSALSSTSQTPPPSQVGFIVSRAVGSAVVRNRVRRRLRHLMRERLALLPPGSLLVVRALPDAAKRSYAELGAELDTALERARRPRRSQERARHATSGEASGTQRPDRETTNRTQRLDKDAGNASASPRRSEERSGASSRESGENAADHPDQPHHRVAPVADAMASQALTDHQTDGERAGRVPVPDQPPADQGVSRPPGLMARLLALPIVAYRRWVSPALPARCRFHPTCSAYALRALATHGALRGTVLAVRRVLRCHPFHPGGYDPVPPPPIRHRRADVTGAAT